jgi:AraC-like DNA-binding protein
MAYIPRALVALVRSHVDRAPMIRMRVLAKMCGVSVGALGRALRAETGLRFRDWQRAYTQRAAERLLCDLSFGSVKEVSGALGFASQHSFSRWFRRQTGMSPSMYRERHAARAVAEVKAQGSSDPDAGEARGSGGSAIRSRGVDEDGV